MALERERPLMASKPLRSFFAGVAVCLLLAATFTVPAATAQDMPVKLMVLGETHGTKSVTRSLVNVAVAKGATGCLCPGDFIYGDWAATPSGWRSMMAPLSGTMLPAQGNHDWPWSDWSGLFPGGRGYYERDVNGAQVISLNTEASLAPGSPQRVWLEERLNARDASAIKVVFMHRPWWLPDGARHPASEFAAKNGASGDAMHALMKSKGVDLVVAGHEKNYQHSTRDGLNYVVAGGGGSEFYGMAYTLPGAVKRLQSNVVSTVELTSTSLLFKTYDASQNKIEEFAVAGSGAAPAPTTPTPAPAPSTGAVSFTPSGGNEWWVQAAVSGATVTAVDARDTNGAYVPLAYRTWGAWAGSFRVEPGNQVQYRARLADGSLVESCWYAHPAGGCASGATSAPAPSAPAPAASAFAATFTNVRGNSWWVEAEVAANGGTLAAVEARVNGGAWVPLAKTSWGSWAKSMSAPTGSIVELRARAADGATAQSPTYAWPR